MGWPEPVKERPMRRRWPLLLAPIVALGTLAPAPAQTAAKRTVLVELYTSQGCDMCPEAEALLGTLGEANPGIAPVAMHVDYFNKPWKDPFSDPLHSERQAVYNACYKGEKPPEYGLYFTPLLMIDGVQPVNGRDGKAAREAIRRALQRPPAVALMVRAGLRDDGRTADLRVEVSARGQGVAGRELLVCAALRDDRVATAVASGENGGKTLLARYPVRATRHAFVTLEGTKPATVRLDLAREDAWDADRLALVTFVQDKLTGAVHQARVTPWPKGKAKPAGPAPAAVTPSGSSAAPTGTPPPRPSP
jgi:hypothetical protein